MNDPRVLGVMMCILVPISLFAMIFGIVYLKSRESMAMIERGMDPRINKPKEPVRNSYILTWGLLLIGAGVGLFLAFLLDNTVFAHLNDDGSPAVYFSLIAIFGGAGLFLSYRIENKHTFKKEEIEG